MVRILIAIVGVIVGGAVNWGIGMLNVLIFPMPEGVSFACPFCVGNWDN